MAYRGDEGFLRKIHNFLKESTLRPSSSSCIVKEKSEQFATEFPSLVRGRHYGHKLGDLSYALLHNLDYEAAMKLYLIAAQLFAAFPIDPKEAASQIAIFLGSVRDSISFLRYVDKDKYAKKVESSDVVLWMKRLRDCIGEIPDCPYADVVKEQGECYYYIVSALYNMGNYVEYKRELKNAIDFLEKRMEREEIKTWHPVNYYDKILDIGRDDHESDGLLCGDEIEFENFDTICDNCIDMLM